MSDKNGKFFQLDRTVFHVACDIGLNAAVAYIFLACGTRDDNQTSSWGAQSIEKYTGMGRGQAKKAIGQLVDHGLVDQLHEGKGITARYFLTAACHVSAITKGKKPKEMEALEAAEPAWIWLPNALVTGYGNEIPPIERIRRAQDVFTLKMLIELYHLHEIADRGGLSWRVMRHEYERKQFTERGPWVIWEFTSKERDHGPSCPFWTWYTKAKGPAAGAAFWQSWNTIKNAGLLECVPHLIEADTDEGAIIYPCPDDTGTDAEKKLGEAARDAVYSMLGENLGGVSLGRSGDYGTDFLAVDRAYAMVEKVGVYRLVYRPRTSMTAAWHARQAEYEKIAEGFRMLAAEAERGRPLPNRVA